MKAANPVFTRLGTTIFEVMSRLAIEHSAINLGQGFPDVDGPLDLRQAAADAAIEGPNQYPPMMGIGELRQAVAAVNERFYGLTYDWRTEILVTSGATEALADCLLALIEPGDEVVVFEPLYDSYLPIIRRAGGRPRLVRLAPPDWRIDRERLASAFSQRTKLILLNNPMNPAAKVFTAEELGHIAELVLAHDAYAVCDEVYEHIVFDGARHIPLATLAGMRERCLRIGSAGKTFSFTGWKVGYVCGPAELLAPVVKAHQFVTFTTPPHLQKAVAEGLGRGNDYYAGLAGALAAKRDRLSHGLSRLGFVVAPCAGTYFVTADTAPFGLGDDVAACRRLVLEAGVAAIPVSAFYESDPPNSFIRFCFAKRDAVLDAALERLNAWLGRGMKQTGVA